MTAFSDLTLADGQATPINRTFKATALIDGKWTWMYQPAGSTPIGYVTLKSTTTFSKDPNGITTHKFSCRVPFVETPEGEAPRVPYYCEIDVNVKTSGRSTAQERKDLLAYVHNFLASSRASEIVVDGDPPR